MDEKPLTLSYAFSKKFGVLIRSRNETGAEAGLTLSLKKETPLAAFIEAQRVHGLVSKLSLISDQEFNDEMSRQFELSSNNSILANEQLGGELNLQDVARELSEPEDLLESDDDAPIIRLITEAIKENASDIYQEPYETRLSSNFLLKGGAGSYIAPHASFCAADRRK